MAPSVISTHIPLGTLAALLTALEYVLSILSGLSARAAIHGIWLLRLHRGGKAHINTPHRERLSFRKDLLATLLGIWLVIGVALVESNLKPGVRVADQVVNSDLCVSVFGKFSPKRIHMHKPPFRTTVEPWVLRVAQMIDCGARGIASVGVGGTTDSIGVKQDMFAPICAKRAVDVLGGAVVSRPRIVRMFKFGFRFHFNKSEGFTLFPHDRSHLGKDIRRLGAPGEGKGPCGERGISGYLTQMLGGYETVLVQSDNMTMTVHGRVCTLHGKRSLDVLPDKTVSSCIKEKKDMLNCHCLREKASSKQVKSVYIENVSALFLGKTEKSRSFACTSATVRYEYVFINAKFITQGDPMAGAELPVLVPTEVKAVSGHCEQTIASLAQAALLYSADAEWRADQLSNVPRQARYYAYMMAVSCSQFPLNYVRGEEDPKEDGKCLLRPVLTVTEIPQDFRFWILMSGLGVVAVVMVAGLVFRILFTGEVWSVGSAQWSLERLLGGGGAEKDGPEKEALVEVVAVEQNDDTLPEDNRTKGLASKIRAKLNVRSASPMGGEGRGRRRVTILPERLLEYRVRTISLRPGTEDNAESTALNVPAQE